jgi:hypothetical protein
MLFDNQARVNTLVNAECNKTTFARGKWVKLLRAYGGCLGARRRRRAWLAALSFGEPLAGFDPEIPEWGNPSWVIP